MDAHPLDAAPGLDPLNPAAALEALAALPLEARPQALLRLADELERRIEPPGPPRPIPPTA